jgi:RNA polymerase sigma factor (sigma-70 family)
MPGPHFPTTKWSLILSSARDEGAQSDEALAELCASYWCPVYCFTRARSSSAEEAQDLTQEFFLRLLNKGLLLSANPSLGRFRSYLCTSLKNFLADQSDHRNAMRRGGGVPPVSIDFAAAEERYSRDLQYGETPDRIFDRQWALSVVIETCAQLRDALANEGHEQLFHSLRDFLPGGSEPASYAELAKDLRMSESTLKVTIHRLRRRYRDLLRNSLAHTVAEPKDVDDEIRFLLKSLG